jgi:lipoprotein-releasing system permease protein
VQSKITNVKGLLSHAPIFIGEAMIAAGNRVVGIGIKGVSLDYPLHLASLKRAKLGEQGDLTKLKPPTPGELPGIAIGYDLAQQLQVTHGEVVNLVSPISFFGMGHRREATHRSFRVSFIFRFGMHQYDSKFCFVHLEQAQAFFNTKDAVSAIEILATDFSQINAVKRRIENIIGRWPYQIRDWRQMNQNLFRAIAQNKFALTLILLFIILVACLNIAGTLILMTLEKSKDIAILRAMGASSRSVMSIFMTYGLYIGALGTMLGVMLGLIVSQAANLVGIRLDASVYFISKLPIEIDPIEWVIVVTAALLISFIATIYPSMQATKQKPVEILRYE